MRFTSVSQSTNDQQETELECEPYFADLSKLPDSQLEHLRQTGLLAAAAKDSSDVNDSLSWLCLVYDAHYDYVSGPLADQQPALTWHMCSLDASRAWLTYWCLQAQDLLRSDADADADANGTATTIDEASDSRIVQTIASMWNEHVVYVTKQQVERDAILQRLANDYAKRQTATTKNSTTPPKKSKLDDDNTTTNTNNDATIPIFVGGFGGGPLQLAHAANNYAAVLALCCLGTPEALQLLASRRDCMYAWMVTCLQQDDGSFRMHVDGEIDVRATYCLLSVAKLLNIMGPSITKDKAIAFLAACQTQEGGFGGEPFSEAHGGYTFCALAAAWLLGGLDRIDTHRLTEWLVRRQMSFEGGFSGRANKLVDGCYSFWVGAATAIVSMLPTAMEVDPWLQDDATTTVLFDQGMLQRYTLTCAQNTKGGLRDKPSKSRDHYHSCYNLCGLSVAQHCSGDSVPAFGHPQKSRVARTHPVYNIRVDRVRHVLDYFTNLDSGSTSMDTA